MSLTSTENKKNILKLDSFLNKKIIENENKFQNILNISKRKREYFSSDKNTLKEKTNTANIYYTNKTSDKKIIKNNKTDESAFYKKKFQVKKNLNQYFTPKKKIINNEYDFDNHINTINIKNTYISVYQKPKNKSLDNSTRKTNVSANKNLNNKNRNIPKKLAMPIRANNYTLKGFRAKEYISKKEHYFSPSPKSINFEEKVGRLKNEENKKKDMAEKDKKKKEGENKKRDMNVEKTNEKINLKIKEGFLEKQKKKENTKQKKENKKILFNNKKYERIKKNNILIQHKFKEKEKKLRNKTLDKNKKEKINNTISKLYDWDAKRKEKIDKDRKQFQKIEKNKYIPKINRRSASMAELKKEKYGEKNIFDRLSKEDPQLVEKKKILKEIYTPSFKPNIITRDNYKTNKKKEKEIIQNEENEDSEPKYESENDSKEMETIYITSISNQYIYDDNVHDLYRNAIFQNKNKHIKIKGK